ncbi:MAG: NAD(P)H-hydrate dehydratase [Clostridia bacterium]|nr:NAD(P)H-hydrate dehydratase [Clostridia bacterium]
MNKVVNPTDLKNAEITLISNGVSEDQLIKIAGKKLYDRVVEIAVDKPVLCVVGSGNNGSDALEVAILLKENDREVAVMLTSESAGLENEKRRKILMDKGVKFTSEITDNYGVIVDGIYGIGFSASRKLDDIIVSIIEKINHSSATVISADIPSGVDAKTGEVAMPTVCADITVTFSAIKVGQLIGYGRNYCGKIVVEDIGIDCPEVGLINQPTPLGKRKTVTHKGTYGLVKIVGGCSEMVGAPYLAHQSATACLRSGAGLVTLCIPKSEKNAYNSRVTENMLYFIKSKNGKIQFNEKNFDEIALNTNAIVIGPGMGKSEETAKCVLYLAQNFDGVLVVDADGINSVCTRLEEIKEHKCKLIFTPHLIEFNRLLGRNSTDLVADAKAFAKEYNCVIAVKSATTIITDGNTVFFNLTGTPAMAKGGSGDVLAGIVGAFACIEDTLSATARACYEFGLAGERAVKRLNSEVSVLASDIIVELK